MLQNQTLVSSMTAHRIWVFCIAILRLFNVSWWYSWVPWEKLNLATFMPARRSFSSIGTVLEDGPNVQTILVFGIRPSFGRSFMIPAMSMLAISSIYLLKRTKPTLLQKPNITSWLQKTLSCFYKQKQTFHQFVPKKY